MTYQNDQISKMVTKDVLASPLLQCLKDVCLIQSHVSTSSYVATTSHIGEFDLRTSEARKSRLN